MFHQQTTHLQDDHLNGAGSFGIQLGARNLVESIEVPIGERMEIIEKIVILATLEKFGLNRTRTAKALGIGIRTLQRRLKVYGFGEQDEDSFENELTGVTKLTTTSSSPELG